MNATNDVKLGLHILEVEITTRCNLNCEICYNRGQGIVDLPLEKIISLYEFAKQHNVQQFILSGGEACLHPDFSGLVDYLSNDSSGPEVVIQSNGLISEFDVESLRAFKLIHLSIEPEVTGIRHTVSEEIIATARKFNQDDIYTYLFATIHQGNINMIDQLVEMANANSIDIGFNLCIPIHGRTKLALTASQREFAIRKLFHLSKQGKILRFTSPFTALLKGTKSDSYIGNRGGCIAGIASCTILPTGDVVPCPFFRLKVGNIFDMDLKKIWFESDLLMQLRFRDKFDEPCGSCQYLSYCGGCRARSFQETGKLTGADPDCLPSLKQQR